MTGFDRVYAVAAERTIPFEVTIELTHLCNFRCQHCYLPAQREAGRLSTARTLSLLEELAAMGTMRLVLSGGEPLLCSDWLEIAQRARELGLILHIYTNGSLINEDVVATLRPLDPFMEVSLYSMDQEVFEHITGVPGSFHPVIRGIELMCEAEMKVSLKIPLMDCNWQGLGSLVRFAETVGAEWSSYEKLVARKDGRLENLDLRLALHDLTRHYRNPLSGCRPPESGKLACDGPLCAAATRYCCIGPTGDVMACNLLPESGGNLNRKTFREVWERSAWFEELRRVRVKDLHTCRSCDRLPYCGRCHAQALVEDGDLLGPSRWACEHAAALEDAFRSAAK